MHLPHHGQRQSHRRLGLHLRRRCCRRLARPCTVAWGVGRGQLPLEMPLACLGVPSRPQGPTIWPLPVCVARSLLRRNRRFVPASGVGRPWLLIARLVGKGKRAKRMAGLVGVGTSLSWTRATDPRWASPVCLLCLGVCGVSIACASAAHKWRRNGQERFPGWGLVADLFAGVPLPNYSSMLIFAFCRGGWTRSASEWKATDGTRAEPGNLYWTWLCSSRRLRSRRRAAGRRDGVERLAPAWTARLRHGASSYVWYGTNRCHRPSAKSTPSSKLQFPFRPPLSSSLS